MNIYTENLFEITVPLSTEVEKHRAAWPGAKAQGMLPWGGDFTEDLNDE